MKQAYRISGLALSTIFAVAQLSAQSDCDLSGTVAVTSPTCGQSNGSFDLTPTGGTPPYFFQWSTGETTEDIANIGVGSYWVFFVDSSKDCWYKVDLVVSCEEDCEFRTQTQGGWGAPPNGNNPAKYLQNNFVSCFPNGVTIGCAGGNTLTLTTSTAVKNFLPAGGTPSQLTADLVNPTSSPAGVLAGQLVAATINVTLDACIPSFSPATSWLGDATYIGGDFDGMSVASVIAMANDFIGGCGGSYSASQFNSALTTLNENYNGGNTDNGNFACGTKEEKSMQAGAAGDNAVLFPNPASDMLTLDLSSTSGGDTFVTITDLQGRVVTPAVRLSSEAGETRRMTVNVNELSNGTYLMVMTKEGVKTTRSFVVSH